MSSHRPNTTEGGGRLVKGRPASMDLYCNLPNRASTAEGKRPPIGFKAAVVGRVHHLRSTDSDSMRMLHQDKSRIKEKRRKSFGGLPPTKPITEESEWITLPTYNKAYDDNPNHTNNMIQERDNWRLERDGFERKKRRMQKSLDDSNTARRELKQKYEAATQLCTSLQQERDEAIQRESILENKVHGLTELNKNMLQKIDILEKQLEELRSAKRPTLRDSDLLRQVKTAEQRIRDLELNNSSDQKPYVPLLTESLLEMFDIKPPLVTTTNCDLFDSINGKDWLRDTTLPSDFKYKVTPPVSGSRILQKPIKGKQRSGTDIHLPDTLR